jgi:hypothetical protein
MTSLIVYTQFFDHHIFGSLVGKLNGRVENKEKRVYIIKARQITWLLDITLTLRSVVFLDFFTSVFR